MTRLVARIRSARILQPLKVPVVRAIDVYRHATADLRVLPEFLIIGAQKCGTSSLLWYLVQHPCIAAPAVKEIRFFEWHYWRGVRWYRAKFPLKVALQFKSWLRGHHCITGEASPGYISHPAAARRVKETLPHAKLIALLRNPVDRALSHYYHLVRWGVETLSLEEAFDAEEGRLAGEKEKVLGDPKYYSHNLRHFCYLSRGVYVEQLKAWHEHFPKEQILVLCTEDFSANTSQVFLRVLRFLGLPAWEPKEYEKHNVGSWGADCRKMRERLQAFYEPHNERLFDYLGQRWDWGTSDA